MPFDTPDVQINEVTVAGSFQPSEVFGVLVPGIPAYK